MTAVRMQKGGLVTHVYNDPETIADAEKKGFRLYVGNDARAEPIGEAQDAGEPAEGSGESPAGDSGEGEDAPAEAPADASANAELAGKRRRSSG